MILEDGKSYRSRDGRVVRVAGTTRNHPEWVWTYQGDWYERATGYYVFAHREKGYIVQPDSYMTLVSEA